MQFTNGFWGEYARKRGSSINQSYQAIGLESRRILYYFLAGERWRIGPQKRRALCRHWGLRWRELEQVIKQHAAQKQRQKERAQ